MKQIGLLIAVLGWILSPTVLWIGIWPWGIVCVALILLNGWMMTGWIKELNQADRKMAENQLERLLRPSRYPYNLATSSGSSVPPAGPTVRKRSG